MVSIRKYLAEEEEDFIPNPETSFKQKEVESNEKDKEEHKEETGEDDDYQEYVPVKKRRLMEQQRLLAKKGRGAVTGSGDELDEDAVEAKPSLLVQSTQLKKEAPVVTETEQKAMEELEMFERLVDKKQLMSVRELAKGIHVRISFFLCNCLLR